MYPQILKVSKQSAKGLLCARYQHSLNSLFSSFLLQLLTVLMKQTRQLLHAIKLSIYLDVYACTTCLVCPVGSVSGCRKKHPEKQVLVAGTKQSKLGPMLSNFFAHNFGNLVLSQSVCQRRLEKLATEKHTSLFQIFVYYRQKSFITLGPGQEGSWGCLIFSRLCFVPTTSVLVLLKWMFNKLIC